MTTLSAERRAEYRALARYTTQLHVVSTDLLALLDMVEAGEAMQERCAQVCEDQKQGFLSPQYASNQPLGSMLERFACDCCAAAIRDLPAPPAPESGDER